MPPDKRTIKSKAQSAPYLSLIDEYKRLSLADKNSSLEAEGLMRLATLCYLTGKNDESEDIWVRAYNGFLATHNDYRAIRCAFWLSFQLFNSGDHAKGGGWIARAQRLLEKNKEASVEQGYFLLPLAYQSIIKGETESAYEIFTKSALIGERFNDTDLIIFSLHGQGRALLRMGEIKRGLALLDEVMIAVTTGDVSELFAGDIYCSVIEGCHEVFDMERAKEWTVALSKWCETKKGMVPYRGQCLVRRAEIKQHQGEWVEAMQEAMQAGEWLSRPPGQSAAGEAYYRQAEIYRLRGEFKKSETAYKEGNKWGRKPQPGLALLRLAEKQTDVAKSSIKRALDETQERRVRAELLAAYVQIMIATADFEEANKAAKELSEIADTLAMPILNAKAAYAQGCILLAEDNVKAALEKLRFSWTTWNQFKIPYESACAGFLIGRACKKLGDQETAEMEFNAARLIFEQLQAIPDIARVDHHLNPEKKGKDRFGLTQRELQILRLVSAGHSNKNIAQELFISERTVERHISNIFIKLNLSSRTAATAWAYDHQIV